MAGTREIYNCHFKKPFKGDYDLENIVFRNVNDPHYWKEEYIDNSVNHVLACKF